VLGVMLPGGPYAELSEARRRTRFAVLSGLERQDFIGQTQDHIGCWAPEIADNPFTPREIPFEWFNQKSDKKRRILVLWLNEDLFDQWPLKGISSVLDKLGTTSTVKIVGPYTSNVLESMIEEAPPKNEAPPKKAKPLLRERHAPYQMVAAARTQGEGRSSSSRQRTPAFVRVSVAEVDPSPNNINQQSSACPISQRDQKEKTGWNRLDRDLFYSYGATTDESQIPKYPNPRKCKLRDYFENYGIHFQRWIATDRDLAKGIAQELDLRRVQPGKKVSNLAIRPLNKLDYSLIMRSGAAVSETKVLDHVALISEWDTIYGRTIAPTMIRAFAEENKNNDANCAIGEGPDKYRPNQCPWAGWTVRFPAQMRKKIKKERSPLKKRPSPIQRMLRSRTARKPKRMRKPSTTPTAKGNRITFTVLQRACAKRMNGYEP
jgi:hypothetical protein